MLILSPPQPTPPRRGCQGIGLALWCVVLTAGFAIWIGLYILAKLIRMVL